MFGNFWLQEISIHLIILKSLLRNFVSACVLILLENDRTLPHTPLTAVPPPSLLVSSFDEVNN